MRRLITIAAVLAAGLATAQEHQRVAVETTTRQVSVSAGNTAAHIPESLYSSAVLWLPFGRNTGTNYYDCSRSSNNGTATNAATQPAWATNSLLFDGANDNVEMVSPIAIAQSNYTVAVMVYPLATNQSTAWSDGSVPAATFVLQRRIQATAGKWQYQHQIDGGTYPAVTGGTVVVSQWVSVAATYVDGVAKIYEDGIQTGSAAMGQSGYAATRSALGVRLTSAPGFYFSGNIGEAAFFSRALSSNEVYSLSQTMRRNAGL